MANTLKEIVNKSKASCCVPLCTRTGYSFEEGKKVSFHRFPLEEPRKREWLVKIRRDEGPTFRVGKSTRICSRHFLKTDFLVTKVGKKTLMQKAYPKVFPWTMEKRVRTPCKRVGSKIMVNKCDIAEVSTCPAVDTASEIETLQARVTELERQLKIQKEAAAFFQKERDLLRAISRKQKKNETKNDFSLSRFKYSDEDICFYTGFPTYTALMHCYNLLNVGPNGEGFRYINTASRAKRPS